MSDMTVGELIALLSKYDSDMRVCADHSGVQSFAPCIHGVYEMYASTREDTSRGDFLENVREEAGGEFQIPVVVLDVGW